MRPSFVETKNYRAFRGALDHLEGRGAEECRLIVVDGAPGLGKTTILQRWAALGSCFYLRAKDDWTTYWLMQELLEVGRMSAPHGHAARFNSCLQLLAERQRTAEMVGNQFIVVLDEADYISAKPKLMNLVRDLADVSGVCFVLVGMGRIRDNLVRFPQTASRVSQYVRFEPEDVAGVTAFLATKCEVKVAPCLAAFVASASGGYNREIVEAIKNIERFGLRHPPSGDDGLTMRDMAGQLLLNDRKTGNPITVPGGK
ncbi:AAA family ATPase [Paracoccus sp. (in: a-proteobacteria)]|uniref:AAA family ATPase n=1 Tax=Paracoccus sp. TaxID=267 RepID=UPI0026DF15E6|nr:ATP-binding protein [Paracoccus sp. (in: a-proteobacteria)]MDO5648360.1 ATP-binding protein [Paracoccus sp. (in: a-proteobacteria)]